MKTGKSGARNRKSGPVYHIVSHTHWDREWYLSFESFRARRAGMMDDLIDLLERCPDFASFTLDGQSVILEDYLAVRPEQESRIRRLAQAGRLFAGPWYVLPDEFLVSGEALLRNLLIGRSVARRYGAGMDVGYIPDSFGHAAMMPSILRGFGMESAIVYRGFGGEKEHATSEYLWRAPDGATVLMEHLHRHGYSGAYFHGDDIETAAERFERMRAEVDARATTPHRLLLSGGDHFEADPSLPGTLEALRRCSGVEILHSSLPAFMDSLAASVPRDLPVVEGELRSGYRYAFVMHGGVYSARMPLKQENHVCEKLLERYAEPLHLHAVLLGMPPQSHLLEHAWKTLLQNHPHDSICGCSIDDAHRDMESRFRAVRDVGNFIIERALDRLLPETGDASSDDASIALYNPSPFRRGGTAEAEIHFHLRDVAVGINPDYAPEAPAAPPDAFALLDEAGREMPFQIIRREDRHDIRYSGHAYPKQTFAKVYSIRFHAGELPPAGFARFKVEARPSFTRHGTRVRAGKFWIENEHLRAEVRANGTVDLCDKSRNVWHRKLHVLEDGGDAGDEYTWSPPARDRMTRSETCKARVSVIERGTVSATLRVEFALRIPAESSPAARSRRSIALPVRTDIRLDAGGRVLIFETTVDNRAKDHRLRAMFSTGIRTRSALVDSAFTVLEREAKDFDPASYPIEHPPRTAPLANFVTLRDEQNGLTLLSAGLPEYEVACDGSGRLWLTLLRCVGQLGADGLLTRPGGKGGWHNETPEAQLQGGHVFRYALFPHSAADTAGMESIIEENERFQLPFHAIRRKCIPPLPEPPSLLEMPPSVAPSAFKLSEDGKAAIIRFWNPSAHPRALRISVHAPYRSAGEAQLDERPLGGDAIDGSEIVLRGHGLKTFRYELFRDRTPAG